MEYESEQTFNELLWSIAKTIISVFVIAGAAWFIYGNYSAYQEAKAVTIEMNHAIGYDVAYPAIQSYCSSQSNGNAMLYNACLSSSKEGLEAFRAAYGRVDPYRQGVTLLSCYQAGKAIQGHSWFVSGSCAAGII